MTPLTLTLPKLIVIERDSLVCATSPHRDSPFHRINERFRFVLKPHVRESFELLFASEVDFAICTKQHGLKDGTMSEKSFVEMWNVLRNAVTPKHFCHIDIPLYVETENPTKIEQFKRIARFYHDRGVQPHEITILDPSTEDCAAAASLGMNPIQTTDLWGSVCEVLGVEC